MNLKTKAILTLCCAVILEIGYILGQSVTGRPVKAVAVLALIVVVGGLFVWRFWRCSAQAGTTCAAL